jgi:uncharacterized cupredoxin-like copper-binding protein
MQSRRTAVFSSALLVFALALAACGGSSKPSISATLDDFKYDPSTWTVPAGQQVSLTLKNAGSVTHDWVLMDKGYTVAQPYTPSRDDSHVVVRFSVDPGQTQTVTFTAPTDPGSYEVVCAVPGHLENGMEGTLTVQ